MAIEDAPRLKFSEFDENEAYNHDRPISSLIRTQLLHLHHAENIVVPAKDGRTSTSISCLQNFKPATTSRKLQPAAQARQGQAAAI